ncbi:MAG: trypsin-like peptidase domain-containing protein [Pisciglobus halotolerans]|nr:trypsin-like peptidase domain-containing protein [Pisciglobus halotolerans]
MKKKETTILNRSFLTKSLFSTLTLLVITGCSTVDNNDTSSDTTNQTEQQANDAGVKKVRVEISSDITDAVAKAEDSVVTVINMQEQNTDGFEGLFGYSEGVDGVKPSDSQDSGSSEQSNLQTASEGSGVIYKKKDDKAYIVTNNHVIADSDAVEVLLKDGTKVEAKLVGKDMWTDLAVLEVPADKIKKVAEFGDSDALTVGEPAIAIGSPLGTNYASSVTSGIISAKNRSVATDTNGDGKADWETTAIQTDAAINPGNSGGALINITGQVVGINSMKISEATVEGMGFAIPSNEVIDIISQLEKNGKVVRPVLGVSLLDLSQISEQQQETVLNLPEEVKSGVVVAKVARGSAADEAGLKQYDVIVEFNGEKVTDSIELRKAIYSTEVDQKIELTYYRDGKKATTTVTMTEGEEVL